MTGLRPGELSHLLLPDDLDLEEGILYVRNKPELDRRVKTRNEREIPLVPPLIKLLRSTLGRRSTGLMFLRRSLCRNSQQLHSLPAKESMAVEFTRRKNQWKSGDELLLSRKERSRIARTVWKDAGLIKTEMIRKEFMRLTKHIDCPEMTAPKMLRHLFATTLQEGNVDPLVRCELMGHSVAANSNATHGLEMTAN